MEARNNLDACDVSTKPVNIYRTGSEAGQSPSTLADLIPLMERTLATLGGVNWRDLEAQTAAILQRAENARLRAELQRVGMVADACHPVLQATPPVCPECQGSGSGPEDPDAILGGEHQVCAACQGSGRREGLSSVAARLEALEQRLDVPDWRERR